PNTTIYTVPLKYYDPLYGDGKEFIATVPIIYKTEDNTAKVQPKPTEGVNTCPVHTTMCIAILTSLILLIMR
ncbi:MAG: hypothetical protein ACKPKO_31450, partial [Candidatus Fonsibacter sp.]